MKKSKLFSFIIATAILCASPATIFAKGPKFSFSFNCGILPPPVIETPPPVIEEHIFMPPYPVVYHPPYYYSPYYPYPLPPAPLPPCRGGYYHPPYLP